MKFRALFILAAIALSINLTGCSSSSQPTTPVKTTKVMDIKTGTSQMLAITSQLKQALAAGDETKVKQLGAKLETTWSQYEDQVKAKHADLYKNVETYLDPTIAGTEASPLNKNAVSKLNDQLIQALQELVVAK